MLFEAEEYTGPRFMLLPPTPCPEGMFMEDFKEKLMA